MEKCRVTFYPDNKTVEVPKGETLLAAALSADIYLSSTCGGDGVCGRCKVLVKKGNVVSQPTGRVSAEEKEKGVHLACLTVIEVMAMKYCPSLAWTLKRFLNRT